MAILTRLLILIQNIYILWDLTRLHLFIIPFYSMKIVYTNVKLTKIYYKCVFVAIFQLTGLLLVLYLIFLSV